MPLLGTAKKRIGARLNSRATIGEGVQNMLCAYLAAAVLAGLLANTWFGLWWADPVIALGIAALAVHEGREAWEGEDDDDDRTGAPVWQIPWRYAFGSEGVRHGRATRCLTGKPPRTRHLRAVPVSGHSA